MEHVSKSPTTESESSMTDTLYDLTFTYTHAEGGTVTVYERNLDDLVRALRSEGAAVTSIVEHVTQLVDEPECAACAQAIDGLCDLCEDAR